MIALLTTVFLGLILLIFIVIAAVLVLSVAISGAQSLRKQLHTGKHRD